MIPSEQRFLKVNSEERKLFNFVSSTGAGKVADHAAAAAKTKRNETAMKVGHKPLVDVKTDDSAGVPVQIFRLCGNAGLQNLVLTQAADVAADGRGSRRAAR